MTQQAPVVATSDGAAAPGVPAEKPLADPAAAPGHPAAPVALPGADPEKPAAPGAAPAAEKPAPAPVPPEYLEALPEASRAQYEPIGRAFMESGVNSHVGSAALTWIDSVVQTGVAPAAEAVAHRYDFSAFNFRPEDEPYLAAFGNAMAKANASQKQVDSLLRWYQDTAKSTARADVMAGRKLDGIDRKDAAAAKGEMRVLWGPEYEANIRLVDKYLAGLPVADRERIESERDPETGILALNDPQRLAELAKFARGGLRHEGHGGAKTVAEEIAMIENVMRTDRGRYNRDEKMQARLRDLYRARGN